MTDFIVIKHSFNCGDLITILPGLRELFYKTGQKIKIYQRLNLPSHYYDGQINSTTNKDGGSVCMNLDLFHRMKPLIEAQDYIESFEVWEGQPVVFDYDLTRDSKSIPMPYGDIHLWGEAVFPETSCDLSEQWLYFGNYVCARDYSNIAIINRTQRYNNPYVSYYFLKPFESQVIFSGTKAEHEWFCNQYNLNLELLQTEDFLELADIISNCKFGVFNQSLHWHIADAIKSTRVLEVCSQFPNTFATGAQGYHAFNQQSLEYFFHKLIS